MLLGLGMRIRTAILFSLLCTAGLWARADERFPMLKVGTQVYSNVTVTAVTATDIYFTYANGVANAKLKNLDPTLQRHFNFNPATAETANTPPPASSSSAASEQKIDRKNAQAIMDDAITRVKAIINQPVRPVTRTPDMPVSTSSPGWFHPGAIKPDFKTVDVRSSQDRQFDRRPYVTSDLNPGVAFIGTEIEFNPMTKYFYVDRSLPKKKLTEAEMLEINRLYRIIGQCEEKLLPPSAFAMALISGHKNALIIAAVSLGVLLLAVRLLSSRRMEA
jgi:hypothetical protein